MHQSLRTLDQLAIGDRAVVHRVDCAPRVGCRLMEMGLLPGTPVELVRRAPFGDPLEIRLRGYLLSLRRSEASGVALRPEGQTALDDDDGRRADAVSAAPERFPAHPPRAEPAGPRVPRVLVAGNPNAGKTTIFNALTGARARVGNYPGVTVSRASRRITLPSGASTELVDLPGTYSLSTHSPDEQVAVDEILGRRGDPPDVVVVVVDAGAIERGLYLALQVVESGGPTVVELNMVDEAAAAGMEIDAGRLGEWLGARVVPTVAPAGQGLDALRAAIGDTIGLPPRGDSARIGLPATVESAVTDVEQALGGTQLSRTPAARRSWAVWSLLSHESDEDDVEGLERPVREAVDAARRRAGADGVDLYEALITARYRWIEAVVADVRQGAASVRRTWTDRIDGILTHKLYGMAAFAAVMALLFEALFSWSEPFIGVIESAAGWLQSGVA
ncbi:MAG: 50S ribosome-binding GTPase, partial [Acidobacteria bacterium]|nr:50S ribosome-binding GTPase [Acidobacteriota bacterium]